MHLNLCTNWLRVWLCEPRPSLFFPHAPFIRSPFAQNGGDTNYVVDMDETKLDTEDGILTSDVRGVIRPALKELKIAIIRRTQEFRQVCLYVCM